MTIKSFLRPTGPARHFAELQLQDGRSIRIPGNTPQVGEAVQLTPAEGGGEQPLPDGTYTTQNGYVLEVKNGRIVAVRLAESNGSGNNSTPGENGGNPAASQQPQQQGAARAEGSQFAALQAELQALRAQLQGQGPQQEPAQTPQGGPAAQGPAAQYPEYDGVYHFHRAAPTPKAYHTEEVAEAMRMIRRAKQGDPDYYFNRANAKKFATGTGVNFNDLLARCPEIAPELFHTMVIEEGLAQNFNIMDVNAQGDAATTVELPTLADTEGGAYLKSGISCSYTPSGQTVLNKRTMDVQPWHYYREYCPKEWGNSFRGMAYVNDEELPYEAVILEYLFSKIRNAWEQTLMSGDASASDPFDGLLTQVTADANIPSGQLVNLDPTPTDAVTEFEKLLAAIPPELYKNVQEAPLLWFVPNGHLEAYVQHYRSKFSSLPYNRRFEKFGPDSALKRATFVPTAFLADKHILSAPENLFIGVGKDMDVDVRFHDAGKEQYLYVRVEGHTGVGYPLSDQIVLGEPSA